MKTFQQVLFLRHAFPLKQQFFTKVGTRLDGLRLVNTLSRLETQDDDLQITLVGGKDMQPLPLVPGSVCKDRGHRHFS